VHVGPTAFLGVNVGSPASGVGVEIESVVSGSPASRAGLIEGDTITSLAGQSMSALDSLTTVTRQHCYRATWEDHGSGLSLARESALGQVSLDGFKSGNLPVRESWA